MAYDKKDEYLYLSNQSIALKKKLMEHVDAVNIRTFEILLSLDDTAKLYEETLDYARDANVDISNYDEMIRLVDDVGRHVDAINAEMKLYRNDRELLYRYSKMYANLVQIHYGLLGILFGKLSPEQFSKA